MALNYNLQMNMDIHWQSHFSNFYLLFAPTCGDLAVTCNTPSNQKDFPSPVYLEYDLITVLKSNSCTQRRPTNYN